MLNLTFILVFEIAISVIKYASLLFILLLILRKIRWSNKSNKKVFPILTNLKIRNIIIIPIGFAIMISILILGIISISSNMEIKSLIKNLKSCDAIAVENSIMRDDGDMIENSIIQDRKKIQDLIRVLSETEYKRSIYRGPIETREWVDIHIVSNNRKKPHSFRLISDCLLIGNYPKFTEYESSDKYIKISARKALGISDKVYSVTDLNRQRFEIPLGKGKIWIGTKKEWESKTKKEIRRGSR